MIVNDATMLYYCTRVRSQSAVSIHFECQPASLCVELTSLHRHPALPSVGWNVPPDIALQRTSAAGNL
jgi:hypothetical protein